MTLIELPASAYYQNLTSLKKATFVLMM